MKAYHYFSTPIFAEEKPEFVTSLNKSSNKFISDSKKKEKHHIKKYGDFGKIYHSVQLTKENDFIDFRNYVGERSVEYLINMGYDMSIYSCAFTQLWVQEFAKKGGGHHSAHVHWNQHVSGFYFLKCSDKTSYPIFHEPRPGAEMTKLPLKNQSQITMGTNQVHYKPNPGTMIIFPGYVPHEFAVDAGLDPFRFIHFNIKVVETAISKEKSIK